MTHMWSRAWECFFLPSPLGIQVSLIRNMGCIIMCVSLVYLMGCPELHHLPLFSKWEIAIKQTKGRRVVFAAVAHDLPTRRPFAICEEGKGTMHECIVPFPSWNRPAMHQCSERDLAFCYLILRYSLDETCTFSECF